jgi:hypothetical protein
MTEEGKIVKACLEYLVLNGVYAWRNNSGARGGVRYGKVGSADILGIMPDGRFLAIECKTATGRATDEQEAFLAEVESRGGVSGIARGIPDMMRIMRWAR